MKPSVRNGLIAAALLVLVGYPLFRYLRNSGASETEVPAEAAAHVDRSLAAYQAGKYQDAIDAANAALKIKPDYALAYNDLAVSYLGLRNYDEAIRNAQEAVRIQPTLQIAANNLAWIQREKAQANTPPPAPGTAGYYVQQSLELNLAGKYQESVAAAQHALKLDPTDAGASARAYNNIAADYASLQMWDKAIENAQKALQLQPEFELAKNNLKWAQDAKAKAVKK